MSGFDGAVVEGRLDIAGARIGGEPAFSGTWIDTRHPRTRTRHELACSDTKGTCYAGS